MHLWFTHIPDSKQKNKGGVNMNEWIKQHAWALLIASLLLFLLVNIYVIKVLNQNSLGEINCQYVKENFIESKYDKCEFYDAGNQDIRDCREIGENRKSCYNGCTFSHKIIVKEELMERKDWQYLVNECYEACIGFYYLEFDEVGGFTKCL